MIPGRRKPHKAKHFQSGIQCGVIGCPRRARHEWAYPCAITTDAVDLSSPRWIPLCDECDVEMNRRLLEVVGVPPHVLGPLLDRYRAIQADGAFGLSNGG